MTMRPTNELRGRLRHGPSLALALVLAIAAGACRGGISESPPIHPNLDMDFQESVKAQEASPFPEERHVWADRRGMRTPPAHTIARGNLRHGDLYEWKTGGDSFVAANPLPYTLENIRSGQARYNVHCAPCHDQSGSGNGLVLQRAGNAFAKPPHLATEPRLLDGTMTDGELFNTITMGKGTMPAYAHQIPVEDRWMIVQYVRALQEQQQ
jgi:mono/diheme cytochrome c family protein